MNIPHFQLVQRKNKKTDKVRVRRYGLSLVEVTMSTFLVAVLMISALQTVGASFRAELNTSRRTQAALFAEDLLSEIIQQEYEEQEDTAVFGREAGESDTDRTNWDDADDYHNWSSSPLQHSDGTTISDTTAWTRAVSVEYLNPANLAESSGSDQGLKQITVTVSYEGEELATLVVLQSKAWINTIPNPENSLSTGSMPSVNQAPTAQATASPTSGTNSVSVQFDASTSTDPDGDPIAFSWDFNDGTAGTGSKPSHTFTNSTKAVIVRNVVLTATDSSGAQSTKTVSITINPSNNTPGEPVVIKPVEEEQVKEEEVKKEEVKKEEVKKEEEVVENEIIRKR